MAACSRGPTQQLLRVSMSRDKLRGVSQNFNRSVDLEGNIRGPCKLHGKSDPYGGNVGWPERCLSLPSLNVRCSVRSCHAPFGLTITPENSEHGCLMHWHSIAAHALCCHGNNITLDSYTILDFHIISFLMWQQTATRLAHPGSRLPGRLL